MELIPVDPKDVLEEKPKKIKEISIYPEITERSIIPEDECCKKVCPVINDQIKKSYKGIRTCEFVIGTGAKASCYDRAKHETDVLLALRTKLAERDVCKCYETDTNK